MLQWYFLLLLEGPKRKVDGSWVETGFHWLWVKDRVIGRLWCEWVPLSYKKSWVESGESKNHKLRSLFDRHWWKRLLWNSWRNMSTHVSWLQAPQTILFKCHWFDPDQTQETKDVGLVEIRQSSIMSTLWLNRPRKCIISHTSTKPTNIYRVGTLCTRYRHTVDYLSQIMKTTT
jgi:hypothetical protein